MSTDECSQADGRGKASAGVDNGAFPLALWAQLPALLRPRELALIAINSSYVPHRAGKRRHQARENEDAAHPLFSWVCS